MSNESLPLKERLAQHMQLDNLVELLNSDESIFHRSMEVVFSNEHPYAWRAAWVIGHTIKKNDPRVIRYTKRIIDCLIHEPDGYQRELLKILSHVEIDEDLEGMLFDQCLNLWEHVSKIPSVRITAIRFVLRVAKKYPELNHEVELVLSEEYLEPLSPGIRRSLEKAVAEWRQGDD